MYIHNLNSVLFNFGIFEIRWYSLAYIFGILLGWWLGRKIINFKVQSDNIKFNLADFDDLVSYIIISIILGGRLGYVIFYNLSYFLENPLDIIKIWEGGMSFHGALIGITISTYLFALKRKIKLFFLLDVVCCVVPIGLFLGRIANFINAELYGKPSNLFFAVIFPLVDNVPRHPSQLYEAFLEGLVIFLILNILIFKKNIKSGVCSGLFLILYGVFRVFSEQFREPDIQLGYIFNLFSMGTILSFFMLFFGGIIIFKANNEKFI